MARYIDADELIKDIERRRLIFKDTITVAEAILSQGNIIRKAIENAPTADVAEVKHEHWYIVEYEYFTCSGCGDSYYNGCYSTAEAKERLKNGEVPNFCPNCGAKMDGGKSNEEDS